jgi:hypothetical protein
MTCQPNWQSTLMDTPEARALPRHLHGMVAPVAVWEFVFSLMRRVKTLEAKVRAQDAEADSQ